MTNFGSKVLVRALLCCLGRSAAIERPMGSGGPSACGQIRYYNSYIPMIRTLPPQTVPHACTLEAVGSGSGRRGGRRREPGGHAAGDNCEWLQAQVANNQATIASLQAQVANQAPIFASLQAQVANQAPTTATPQAQIVADLQAQVASLQAQVANNHATIASLQAQAANQAPIFASLQAQVANLQIFAAAAAVGGGEQQVRLCYPSALSLARELILARGVKRNFVCGAILA